MLPSVPKMASEEVSKKGRRNWTQHEKDTLLSILEELVLAGYKGENGMFKTGTHEEATKRMRSRIPGIVITCKQVVNKMKRWSTKFGEVVDMMNTRGFGWDDTRKCVIVGNDQVLAKYFEKHPKVGNHVNKEFKEFERLQGIFGKDRANVRRAEIAADVVEGQNADITTDFEADLGLEEDPNSPGSVGNVVSNGTAPSISAPPPKRQRVLDVAYKLIESIEKHMTVARADMLLIAAKMPDPPMVRSLGEEVKKLGLSEDEEVDLMIKFSHNSKYEKYFWEMQGTQRITFVRKIMGLP